MVELGREFGFDTDVVGPVKVDGIEVSSTKVREVIATGEMHRASKLLGRYHFLNGPVVRGRERGRTIGFPTANLDSETECLPPDGVYATRVILDDGAYPSITNIGMRPTFAETARSIEAHIFDFTRDIYGQRIKLELVERIRPEKKFASAEALKAQIALDLKKAREILAAVSSSPATRAESSGTARASKPSVRGAGVAIQSRLNGDRSSTPICASSSGGLVSITNSSTPAAAILLQIVSR